ncbi:MAG: VIT domain-containing protein [Saprospiraceae bacterium]
MKTNILWIIFCWIGLQSLVFGQNSLKIIDPVRNWTSFAGKITYAEFIVKPGKNFVECDVYMNYLADHSSIKENINHEVAHQFTLPENVLVTDSWLWVDTIIMKALILERNEAFNIYEGIVNRRQDPSILYKNSAKDYLFRIYPILYNQTRRVKLSLTIPIELTRGKRTFTLPTNMISSSSLVPNVVVKILNSNDFEISYQGQNPLVMQHDEKLGVIYKTNVHPTLGSPVFTVEELTPHLQFSYTTETNGTSSSGFYQIALNAEATFEFSAKEDRNVVLVIDHDSIYSHLSKADVLLSVRSFVQNYLSAGDSLQIVYNGIGTKKYYQDFVPLDDFEFQLPITEIKLGDFSAVPSSLFEAYEIAKQRSNTFMIVFTSGGNIVNATQSQSIKNNLVNTYGKLMRTFVNSYVNEKASSVWVTNQHHRGNNLLYNILATNSNGYLQTTPITTKSYDSWSPLLTIFGDYFEGQTQKPFEVQYFLKPEGGLTYDNVSVQKGTTSWFQTGQLFQTGRFAGKPPFILDAVVFIDGQVSSRKIVFDSTFKTQQLHVYKTTHAGYKILDLELRSVVNHKNSIIDLSLENRVLSRHTAFLALEPGLQEPCFDCIDESSTTGTDDETKNVQWKVYPNPFSDIVYLEIHGLNEDERIDQVSLFDTKGAIYKVDIKYHYEAGKWMIQLDGNTLLPGVYIVRVQVGNRVLTYKVVKI